MSVQVDSTQESPQSTKPTATKGNWGTARFRRGTELVFHIEGATQQVVIRPSLRTLIGRTPTHSTQTPDIDLAAFDAIEKGVSRIHASIHQSEDTLTIMDMGSRNGTHINGQCIAPGQQRILRDGDEVRLGKLVVYVHFKRATVPLTPRHDAKANALLGDSHKSAVAGPFLKDKRSPIEVPAVAARATSSQQIPDFASKIGNAPKAVASEIRPERPVYKLPDFVGQLSESQATSSERKGKFRDRIRTLVNQSVAVQEFDAQPTPIEPGQDVSLPSQQPESDSMEGYSRLGRPLPPSARTESNSGMLGRLRQ